MSDRTLRAVAWGVVITAAALTAAPVSGLQDRGPDLLELERRYRQYVATYDDFVCSTDQVMGANAIVPAAPAAAGAPVYFHQDPPILTADYRGRVTFRDLTVVGDVETLTFEPLIFDTNRETPDETWERVRTATIGGVQVSIFEPSWSAAEVDRFFFGKFSGFDRPDLFWGRIVVGTGNDQRRFGVSVRVAPDELPEVRVRRMGPGVFYSSDVVNLVIPGYGDSRIVSDNFDVDGTEVVRMFLENFRDVYHGIAIVPQAVHLADDFGAFHQNVQNSVQGVGLQIFDNTAAFGSGGTLMGFEFYPGVSFGRPETTVHEFLHQWGHYLDWDRVMGLNRAGHQPEAHTPLLDGGPTLIGAVLEGDREVTSGGNATVGFPAVPFRAHPLTMYAMGFLGAGRMPTLTVFQNQGQFNPDTSTSPDVGTALQGAAQEVEISDIREVHGARSGPKAPRKFRRATVVVSRDEQLSQAEFDYWNYVTQRQTYRKRNDGALSRTGYGTLFRATDHKVKLDTSVVPLDGRPIVEKMGLGFPSYGPRSWRGVRLDSRTATRIRSGRTVRISGRVTADDRSDFDEVMVRFGKHDPTGESEPIQVFAPLAGNGTFELEVEFTRAQRGRYYMEFFVFWPGAGSQFSRGARTPFHVQ